MNGKKIAIIVSVAAVVTAGAGAGTYAYIESKNGDGQVVRTAEVTTKATTEKATTEKATKATTKATTEKATTEKAKKEKSTKAATTEAQKMEEATTTEYAAPTEMPTEAQTESPYVPGTEAPTERATEAPTERATEAPKPTPTTTEAATEHVHNWVVECNITETHNICGSCGADLTALGLTMKEHQKQMGTSWVDVGFTKADGSPDLVEMYNCDGHSSGQDVVVGKRYYCSGCGEKKEEYY